MHDPMTVVAHVKIPFTKRTLFTIWHVDPETDGTDDSCNWSGYKYPQELWNKLEEEGKREYKFFFDPELGAPMFAATDLEMLWAVWNIVDWRFGKRIRVADINTVNLIFNLVANPTDNLIRSIQEARVSPDGMGHLFAVVYRSYNRFHRPWYKHPRYHFWHYSIQIHLVQNFKRWAFSRCAGCGKRFKWGYAPTCTQWESTGPQWFKSERNVYHRDCINSAPKVTV